ncbi:hypothetical protein Aph01nite_26540 [Acrocarpospora phusangensis]|uniref:Lipoprotein n=1 Tax=Acrocarpospora phusangensis TaxID=1070424 RepID=A0A919Q8C4_9ACTN|nr:hypothetical protein [Acrocarpospora phusangensis]GIH24344.1 hypothetical protein Aph01nite_26540 [Acrocarpospora phusangensis]
MTLSPTVSPTASRLAKAAAAVAVVSLALLGCGPAATTPSADEAAPEVVSVASQDPTEAAQPEASTEPTETTQPAEEAAAGATVQPGGTLVDGSVVSAELTRAGQKDVYVIDLGEAREFYVADMNGTTDMQFQAFADVDDEPVGLPNLSLSFGTWVFKLTKAGTHRLEVWGNNNTIGKYGFRIATVKPRSFPVAIGMKIGEGSPAGAGRLDVSGRIDRFEFDSDGATAVKVVGGAGACTAIQLELVDAAQADIANARQPVPLCGDFDMPLSNGDGKYALIVRSNTAKTGAYAFELVRGG